MEWLPLEPPPLPEGHSLGPPVYLPQSITTRLPLWWLLQLFTPDGAMVIGLITMAAGFTMAVATVVDGMATQAGMGADMVAVDGDNLFFDLKELATRSLDRITGGLHGYYTACR